ncbi:ATP-binding response regulator [Opitutus terrae]|nr:hybrid sensor histidine kinase/response regulator [Opitutus terrae]
MLTESPAASVSKTAKPLVLVVDDEYGPRESIAFSLSSEFTVETADRAAEALAKLRAQPFAVVVLDIRMPEMDGIRALEEMRKIDPFVSVVMLTGYGTLLTAQQAMLAGANQYLRKPPDIAELLDAVRKQAGAARLRRQQAMIADDLQEMNAALKREMAQTAPQLWQGKASVDLVHDLNNPLTVVVGYSALLLEEVRALAAADPERSDRLQRYAEVVEKAAEYCYHLAENWRMASHQTVEFTRLDLVQIIQEVRHVVFFGEIAVQFSGLTAAFVRGSRFELMRVFQNVFRNALEAGAKQLVVGLNRAGDRIEVSISDNGEGMAPELQQRALKGGFSNREYGLGLGLGICRHLLGTHGATLDLQSAPGQGTTVKMVFPAAE